MDSNFPTKEKASPSKIDLLLISYVAELYGVCKHNDTN